MQRRPVEITFKYNRTHDNGKAYEKGQKAKGWLLSFAQYSEGSEANMYAVVEMEEGHVMEFDPSNLRFLDTTETDLEKSGLEFETVQCNLATTVQRAKVPGGWLVLATDDVWTVSPNRCLDGQGYEWRSGLTFYPDPLHLWK